MKQILSFIVFLLYISCFCQMDTEHWFAPFADATNTKSSEQYLYLSTDRTTAFKVDIYSNNTLYKSVMISHGSPGIVEVDKGLMFTSTPTEKFTPVNMGLHLVGENKFFAHFRFAVPNHAEIITSKGKAGLGKEFFAFTPKSHASSNSANATVGIIATEDNTNVVFSNFITGTILSDGTLSDSSSQKTIRLNKGQSYIIEAIANQAANLNGLSGVHIVSDKEISLTNGCSINVSPNGSNVDIYMDQSSPIDRLGKEYIAVKGNGNLNTKMEQVVLVATEDNTLVRVNGNPTTLTIAKKGQTLVLGSNYYNQPDSSVDTYNMYINSDKNIYAYQLLGGVDDGNGNLSYASGGMNILPQLLCLLPNKIDEFAQVDKIGGTSYNTRLNIITQKGATIKVNGVPPLPADKKGPFPVPGNNEWVTYTYTGVTGNYTIESDKAVTAGIAAGNGAVGYGGYFAGFNSNPVIAKGGNCDSSGNVTLEVDNSYDSYQWYKNENIYTGPGANSYLIKPDGPGFYEVEISKNSCGTLRSPRYKILPCPLRRSVDFTIGNCNERVLPPPHFSISTQTIKPSSITITTPPSGGIATINPSTGQIHYKVTSATATSDSFIYYFEGDDVFPDSEYVTVNISVKRINHHNAEITECTAKGIGMYDLTSVSVSSDTDLQPIQYFENLADAQNVASTNFIADPAHFATAPKTVYARLINSFGCIETAEIVLKALPVPQIASILVDGGKVTINAIGGTAPYLYAWDGMCNGNCDDNTNFDSQHIFKDIPRGKHTAYLKDAKGCEIISKEFIVINLINTITPNDDGYNDVLDYSDLKIKKNVSIKIFDRYGKEVYASSGDEFIWDGKSSGRSVPSDSYWYLLSWTEPDTGLPIMYKGWILVKNR